MVKIPGLDDLKKMGSDLVDSAKSGKLMDKIKSGMEQVSGKKMSDAAAASDNPLLVMLQELDGLVSELITIQGQQATQAKKIQSQVAAIVKVASTYQKPATPEVVEEPVTKEEDKKQ